MRRVIRRLTYHSREYRESRRRDPIELGQKLIEILVPEEVLRVLRVCDPHCRVELEDILEVEGRVDEAGLPLGRCLVQVVSGEELGGVWRAGRREGLGGVTGPGLEQRGLRSIRGYYQAGQLQGPGQVSLLDGSEFQCNFVSSRAEGGVVSSFTRTETELDQETCSPHHVTTGPIIGAFRRGILSGPVWVSQLGGGWLHGVPDHRGEMTGDEIMYIYPDLTTVLCGSFTRGVMVRAFHTRLADIGKYKSPHHSHSLSVSCRLHRRRWDSPGGGEQEAGWWGDLQSQPGLQSLHVGLPTTGRPL